jgi:long-chain acyl-CoA synthetase
VQHAAEDPGEGQDLLDRILRAATTYPNRPALSGHRGRPMRYRDLAVSVIATAKGLRRSGFQSGDRLLFSIRPDPEAIVLALGTVAAGGSVVFVHPGVGPELFSARVALAQPAWAAAESVLYAGAFMRTLKRITRRDGVQLPDYAALGIRTLRAGPWLPGVPAGTISISALAKGRGPVDEERLPGLRDDPGAEATVVFTSGTTGPPRAVVHTRGSLGAALSVLAERYEIDQRAQVYSDQFMLGLPALAAGAHWQLPPLGFAPRADPARYAKGMGKATHTFLMPADLAAVLTAITERLAPRPSTLQQILVGGAPVLPPLVNRASMVLPGVKILAIYGMSEIIPIAIADGVDKMVVDPDGDLVGRLLPGVTARIAADGELMVAGPHLAKRYLGGPQLREHATGDLAILRDRTVVLLGRTNHLIIRGRTTIYPAQYESAIESIPGVGRAAMVGVPDEVGDERVVLALQPAGQHVQEHPLAGTPKGSHSRDQATPDAPKPTLLLDHPLAAAVTALLPDLVDNASLPDQVLVISAIPTYGSARTPDRTMLRRLLAELTAENTS